MRHCLLVLAAIASCVVTPAAHGAERWRWPVDGDVGTPFHVSASPFAPGQHRGIDILARPGTTVRSACSGRVRFAGTAGTSGRTVSILCGPYIVAYLHLRSSAVRAGTAVRPGTKLGAVGTTGSARSLHRPHLHFGVRRATQTFGYVDPRRLLSDVPQPPPALGRGPRRVSRPPLPRLRFVPIPRATPGRAPVPVVVLAGLAVTALGLVGGLLTAERRRVRQPKPGTSPPAHRAPAPLPPQPTRP